MKKNLKVSAVASLIGVCIIGGVVALYPKTESTQTDNQVTIQETPTVNQVTIQEEQTEEPEYDEYDSERLEDEQVVLDGGLVIVPNPEYDRQVVEFKLRQYEIGALTDEELTELKETYGSLVDEVQAELDAENQEVSEPVKSDIVTKTYTSDGFISMSIDENLMRVAQTYVERVPSKVLDAILSIGYRMQLVNDPASSVGYSENWCGVTSPSMKMIYIEAKERKFRLAIVHEIGHAFDDYLGCVALSDEFKSIYEAEKDSFIVTGYTTDNQFKENTQEFFAEAFQMYVYDSATLQSSAPRTFEFVKNCIDSL